MNIADYLPTRRAVAAQLGVLASLSPFPADEVASANAPGPIEEAYPLYVRLMERWDAACEATWAAEDRYEKPIQPYFRYGHSEGRPKAIQGADRVWHDHIDDSDDNIDLLRKLVDETPAETPPLPIAFYDRRRQNAQATLAAILGWKEERDRRANAAGYTEACEVEERARERAKAQVKVMLETKAKSFRELAFQARVVLDNWASDDSSNVNIRLAEFAGIQAYHLRRCGRICYC